MESRLRMRLRDALDGWTPRTETSTVVLDAATVAVTADVLDVVVPGDTLPPLWHWPHFAKRTNLLGLGEDGHPHAGALYPPIPDRRRMFVGGRVTVHRDIRIGWSATVEDAVVDREVKRGRSGEMLFVTVRRTVAQGGEVCVVEEQDIMYRSGDAARRPEAPQQPLGPAGTSWSSTPRFTPAKLFVFSAITSNAHRIHYDAEYARSVEGYPGLVVHGPLLVLSMLDLVRTATGRPVASLSYRLERPVICGDAVRVEAQPGEDDVEVLMRSSRHDVVASATVRLR